MQAISVAEFHRRLKAQGVPCVSLAFKCPMCGTVQNAQDLIKAGAGESFEDVEKYLGFSCVGRWTHRQGPPKKKGTQVGCNWTLGGLFRLHELEIIDENGKAQPLFEVCTPEEAAAHLAQSEGKEQP